MPVEGLPVPDKVATADPNSTTEILRLWWIEGQPGAVMWPALADPEWFGVVLSDVCRQMAQSYEQAGRGEASQALEKITQGLTRALQSSTYAPGGGSRSGEITVERTGGTASE